MEDRWPRISLAGARFRLWPHLLILSSQREHPWGCTNTCLHLASGWRVMRTAILLIASCRLHPLRASLGKRPHVSLSWALAAGSRTAVPSPLSSPLSHVPASPVRAAPGMGQVQGSWVVRNQGGSGKRLNLYRFPSLFFTQSSQIANLTGPLAWTSLESCLLQLGKRAKEVRCQSC